MQRFIQVYSSIIGKKYIAAVTGLVLFGFLVGHVTGNLKVFLGDVDGVPDIDIYGAYLKQIGVPMLPPEAFVWMTRTVLLVCLVLHVVTVIQLAMINNAARPVGYVRERTRAASLAAKYMMFSGLFLLFFIVIHLLHFTTGVLPSGLFGDFEHGKIYGNIFNSFAVFPIAIFYIVAMAVVGFHLFHGVWSLFQTLGLDNPDRNKLLRIVAVIFAVGLFVGFSSIPLAFMLGFMDAPPAYDLTKLPGH